MSETDLALTLSILANAGLGVLYVGAIKAARMAKKFNKQMGGMFK